MTLQGSRGSLTYDEAAGVVVIRRRWKGETRLRVRDITSITVAPATVGRSAVRLAVAGGSVAPRALGFGDVRVALDPYALVFSNRRRAEADAVVEAIERGRDGVRDAE